MADFKEAFKKTLEFEGEYADHSLDRGKKTMYGITEAVARAAGYEGEIKDLPLETAEKIYHDRYWKRLNCDSLQQEIADELFDSGVNCGIITAGKFFQAALNLLNKNQILYPDMKIDGIIGAVTITYYQVLTQKESDRIALLKTMNGLLFEHYHKICENNPAQEVFFKGWLRRVTI